MGKPISLSEEVAMLDSYMGKKAKSNKTKNQSTSRKDSTVTGSKPLMLDANAATGGGGFALDISKINADISKKAVKMAAESSSDPADRIINAFKLMSSLSGSGNVQAQDGDALFEEAEQTQQPKKETKRVVEPYPELARELKLHKVDELEETVNKQNTELELLRAAMAAQQDKRRRRRIKKQIAEQRATMTKAEQPADFDCLKIPNLSSTAQKPTFRVQFDLGRLGKQEAWYHWISEHDGCLALVYDTRFEFGIRYSPPNMDKIPIKIKLPDHKKEYVVYSMDFNNPFGVFFITNLVIATEATNKEISGPPMSEMLRLTDIQPGILPGNDFPFEEDEYNGEEWRD